MPYIVGYFSVLIGLLLVQGVMVAFLLPAMALVVLLWVLFGEFGAWLGTLIIAPAWLWLAGRFFFPALMQIIWIDGRPALFAFARVTPRRMISVVTAQIAILRSDLLSFSRRMGGWLSG